MANLAAQPFLVAAALAMFATAAGAQIAVTTPPASGTINGSTSPSRLVYSDLTLDNAWSFDGEPAAMLYEVNFDGSTTSLGTATPTSPDPNNPRKVRATWTATNAGNPGPLPAGSKYQVKWSFKATNRVPPGKKFDGNLITGDLTMP